MLWWWGEHARSIEFDRYEHWSRFLGGGGGSKDEHKDTPSYLRKNAKVSRAEAAELLANPLRDFPKDVRFLTAKEIDGKVDSYRHALVKEQNNAGIVPRIVFEAPWDDHRIKAVSGELGDIEHRAAQNDVLWAWFLGMERGGVKVTLPLLRQRVEIDIVRSRLYPSSDYIAAENRKILSKMVKPVINPKTGKPEGKFTPLVKMKPPFKVVDNNDPRPPKWYLDRIRSKNVIEPVVKYLDGVVRSTHGRT